MTTEYVVKADLPGGPASWRAPTFQEALRVVEMVHIVFGAPPVEIDFASGNRSRARPTFPVLAKRCDECLFGPHPLVDRARKAEILQNCRDAETHFVCHKASLAGLDDVCCRGFYDQEPHETVPMRLAAMLGLVRFIPEVEL